MRVGFTGTRDGMTNEQHRAVIAWMKHRRPSEFHWGVCVGADSDAFDIVSSAPDLSFSPPRTVAHPPERMSMASQADLQFADEVRPATDYLSRNRNIVDACDVLLACPKEAGEERRSGTWATIRYARRVGRPVVIVWPDGSLHGPPEFIDTPPPEAAR